MNGVAGTAGLIRLILRRDRMILPVWLLVIVGTVLQWVGTAATVYPTEASRRARFDEVAGSPMFLLFQGQLHGTSLGAVLVQRAAPVALMVAALGTALIMVRHTRSDEQSGRRELLGSTVVGRQAPLTAVLLVLFGSGLAVGLVCALALAGNGFPVAGSACFGLIVGCGVWVPAAMTAVLVQLSQSARAAAIGGFGLFYAFHLLRGIGAMGGDATAWMIWLTPNGWLENTRPFAGERWAMFAPVALWLVALGGLGYLLSARRDLGAGVVPARLGPAGAGSSLRGPLGLAWRLHRAMMIVWIAAAACFGLIMGAVGSGAMAEYAHSPWVIDFAELINAENTADALFTYIIGAMAIVVALYSVMTALRLRSEEADGGAETILAEPITRRHWLAAHVGFAVVVPLLILTALGLGLGVGSGVRLGDPVGEITHLLGLTVRYAPAVWVITGAVVAAFGLVPRAVAVIGWGALAIGLAAEVAVKASVLPEWVFRALSPFAHAGPAYGPTPVTYLILTLIAATLIALGAATFARRDLIT